jgi:hypothetical protein
MKRFIWNKENERLTRTYPCHYKSDKHPVLQKYSRVFMKAHVASRINGFNTAYAELIWTVEWPTLEESKWGYIIYSHFRGKDALVQAKRWCNFLLNNPPHGIHKFNGPF